MSPISQGCTPAGCQTAIRAVYFLPAVFSQCWPEVFRQLLNGREKLVVGAGGLDFKPRFALGDVHGNFFVSWGAFATNDALRMPSVLNAARRIAWPIRPLDMLNAELRNRGVTASEEWRRWDTAELR